jgi:NAD-dependent deacetylase
MLSLKETISKAAKIIMDNQPASCLTGAGISVESGIPPFRGRAGLWSRYDPEEYATIEAFNRDPVKVWRMLLEMAEILLRAKPNPAHLALAELEEIGILSSVITQNIDGLHQRAGSNKVIELHGSGDRLICCECGKTFPVSDGILSTIPPRCPCGGILRPDVVFFGEPLSEEAFSSALAEVNSCRLLLVIGTSAVIYPAASLPLIARERGAVIIEINPEETALSSRVSNHFVKGGAASVLPVLLLEIKRRIS